MNESHGDRELEHTDIVESVDPAWLRAIFQKL